MMADKTPCLKNLEGILGPENVFSEDERLIGYAEAGIIPGVKPCAVVKPKDTGQVIELIKLARFEKLNLVFSSSLSPHFHGGTILKTEGVVVDMSEMDRIVRMDRRNKVALIEPGVTFGRLSEAADEVGLKVLMPLLPRLGKSVLASCLEREPIMIPKYHWDMTDPLLCTEMVFGTGDLFRTGSASGPGTLEEQLAAGRALKTPMGPGQIDLARVVQGSQGTMAAVTWATVKLEVKPSIHRLWFVPDRKLSRLTDFTYRALRPKLGDEFLILNAFSLASIVAEDPGSIPELAAKQAPWTLIYGVSGYEYLPEERVAYQEKDLATIAQATGVSATAEVAGCTARKMDLILSSPSREPHYKKSIKGHFADIFFLTTLDRVQEFVTVMEREAERLSYPASEIGTYIQPIQQGRTVHLEFTLPYDPADEKDVARARDLFTSAGSALSRAGAFYSRPYGIWSGLAYSRCPDTVSVLKKVKTMFDPDHVLNRGKLCFNEEVM
jgi:FAD/FMN-containing dehydrogenase